MTENRTLNILVTGVGGPAGINASRLLRDEPGVHVIGCDSDELSSGRFFIDKFMRCPRADSDEYESWLRQTVVELQIDILIPTVHEELPVLRTFSDDLPCLVVISSAETLAIGDDKQKMYEWMDANQPEAVARWTNLADWTPDWLDTDKQFIKPRRGRGGRGCAPADRAHITWLQKHVEQPEEIVVMEQLPGTEWTVDCYIGQDGALIYTMVRERLGLAGGISIKGKTVKEKSVINATQKLLSQLSCVGPALVQWKADAAGKPKLVEINPRLSGGLMISRAAGVNPIKNILSEFRGEQLEPQDWQEVTVLGFIDYKKLAD